MSRLVVLVLVMAALGSAGALWAKPPTNDKADRANTTAAVEHGSYAAPTHVRAAAR